MILTISEAVCFWISKDHLHWHRLGQGQCKFSQNTASGHWHCLQPVFSQCSSISNSPRTTDRRKTSSAFVLLWEKFTNGCKVAHLGHSIIMLLDFNALSVVYSGHAQSLKCVWEWQALLINCFWWSWHAVQHCSEH